MTTRTVGQARVVRIGLAAQIRNTRVVNRLRHHAPHRDPVAVVSGVAVAAGLAVHAVSPLIVTPAVAVLGFLAMAVGVLVDTVPNAWVAVLVMAWVGFASWFAWWSPIPLGVGAIIVGAALWVRRRTEPRSFTAPELPPFAAVWADRVAASVLPGTEVVAVERIPGGQRATIALPPGLVLGTLISRADVLAAALMLDHSASLVVDQGQLRSLAEVSVFTASPLRTPLSWPQPLIVAGRSPIGQYVDDGEAMYRWYRPGDGAKHDLIAGVTGAGKSGVLRGLLRTAYDSREVATLLIDPKMGQSAAAWVDHTEGAALGVYAGVEALEDALVLLKERARILGGLRLENFDPLDPRHGMPLLWVAIDEGSQLVKEPGGWGKRAKHAIEGLVQLGRSAGVKVTFLCQTPTLDQLGSNAARSQMQQGNTVCLRIDKTSGAMGANSQIAALASAIPEEDDGESTAGRGYLRSGSSRIVEFRAWDPAKIPGPETRGPAQGPTVLDEMTARFFAERDAVDEALQDDVPPAERLTARGVVLAAVRDLTKGGGTTTANDILAAVPYGRSAVYGALQTLRQEGEIAWDARGNYSIKGKP